jgi:hypothetical protein
MAAKLTRLTRKIAIQLQLVAKSCIIAVPAPGGQSGNFWIHPHMSSENEWARDDMIVMNEQRRIGIYFNELSRNLPGVTEKNKHDRRS